MTLTLHTIRPEGGSRKSKKRIGRGLSKGGSYSGRGVKGQRARSGGRSGLQLKGIKHLMLAIPKLRGFKSFHARPETVNVGDISSVFVDGAKVNPRALLKKQLIASIATGVKVLGGGEVRVKLIVTDCTVSASAKQKIEAAGGSVVSA